MDSHRAVRRSLMGASGTAQNSRVFGDAVVDRLVHHSRITTVIGNAYGLEDKHDERSLTGDNHQTAQYSTGANRP